MYEGSCFPFNLLFHSLRYLFDISNVGNVSLWNRNDITWHHVTRRLESYSGLNYFLGQTLKFSLDDMENRKGARLISIMNCNSVSIYRQLRNIYVSVLKSPIIKLFKETAGYSIYITRYRNNIWINKYQRYMHNNETWNTILVVLENFIKFWTYFWNVHIRHITRRC